jgi:glycosyltransferase involved in cell wall biosynthesis
MIHILYNALHLGGQCSGVRNTIEQLMKEAFANPADGINFEALCPSNYHLDGAIHPLQKLTKIDIDASSRWQRIGYEHFLMNRYFRKKEKHILHSPAYIRPRHWKELSVITVHDLIALDFPEYCSLANRLYFRFLLPQSIRNASKIISPSHSVKEDILRKFTITPDKIQVIYPGINDSYFTVPSEEKWINIRIKYKLPEKFILYVGNIEPKKNIIRLIESFENLIHKQNIPHSLVVAGRFAWKYGDILRIKKQNNGRILFPGYIEQSDLPALYTLADLFVFPSLYEGFGIPPLESMACGTPVIASCKGALPETTGGCAFLVDPLSVDAITSAMLKLLENQTLRNQLINKGKQHVRHFKWGRTWSETVKLYKSIFYT